MEQYPQRLRCVRGAIVRRQIKCHLWSLGRVIGNLNEVRRECRQHDRSVWTWMVDQMPLQVPRCRTHHDEPDTHREGAVHPTSFI